MRLQARKKARLVANAVYKQRLKAKLRVRRSGNSTASTRDTARLRAFNAFKTDPTRSITQRRAFNNKIKKQFALLKGRIVNLIVKEDALGLKPKTHDLAGIMAANAFCATGEGHGQDNSCPPTRSAGPRVYDMNDRADGGLPTKSFKIAFRGRLIDVAVDPSEAVLDHWVKSTPQAHFGQIAVPTAVTLKGMLVNGHAYVWEDEELFHEDLTSHFGDKEPGWGDRFSVFSHHGKLQIGLYTGTNGEAQKVKEWFAKRGMTVNAFCATGEGHGQDNSCPPSKSRGGGLPTKSFKFEKDGELVDIAVNPSEAVMRHWLVGKPEDPYTVPFLRGVIHEGRAYVWEEESLEHADISDRYGVDDFPYQDRFYVDIRNHELAVHPYGVEAEGEKSLKVKRWAKKLGITVNEERSSHVAPSLVYFDATEDPDKHDYSDYFRPADPHSHDPSKIGLGGADVEEDGAGGYDPSYGTDQQQYYADKWQKVTNAGPPDEPREHGKWTTGGGTATAEGLPKEDFKFQGMIDVAVDPNEQQLKHWLRTSKELTGMIHSGHAYVWDMDDPLYHNVLADEYGVDHAPFGDRFVIRMQNGNVTGASYGGKGPGKVRDWFTTRGMAVNTASTFDTPMLEVPDVRQTTHYTCGAAASCAVGKYFGIGPKTQDGWIKALHTDVEQSTHPQSIIDYFTKLGCKVEAKHGMTVQDLANCILRGAPVICPVQDYGPWVPKAAKFAYGHYLTVIGVEQGLGKGYIFCQDSSEDNVIADSGSAQEPGKVMIAIEDWMRMWHDEDIDGNKYIRFGIAISYPTQSQWTVVGTPGEQPVGNVFCPTGPGGGVDPSCSPSKAPAGAALETPPPAAKREAPKGFDYGKVEKMVPIPGSLGIPRHEMPQIARKDREDFFKYVRDKGIKITEETLNADDLTATQGEYNPVRVARVHGGGAKEATLPVLVSGDNYILDGHHHWLERKQEHAPVNVIKLGLPVHDALKLMHDYPKVEYCTTATQCAVTANRVWASDWDAPVWVPLATNTASTFDTPLLEVPDCIQPNHFTCGSCASASVGWYFGVGPKELSGWIKALHTDVEESTRPQAIIEYFRELGCVVSKAASEAKFVTKGIGVVDDYAWGKGFTHVEDPEKEAQFEKLYQENKQSRAEGTVPMFTFESLEDRMIHEIGHNLLRALPMEVQREWEKIYEKNNGDVDNLPSFYAQENSSEMWAESVAALVKGYRFGGTRREYGPNNHEVEDFVAKHIGLTRNQWTPIDNASYFGECKRDEHGYCMEREGGAALESQEPGTDPEKALRHWSSAPERYVTLKTDAGPIHIVENPSRSTINKLIRDAPHSNVKGWYVPGTQDFYMWADEAAYTTHLNAWKGLRKKLESEGSDWIGMMVTGGGYDRTTTMHVEPKGEVYGTPGDPANKVVEEFLKKIGAPVANISLNFRENQPRDWHGRFATASGEAAGLVKRIGQKAGFTYRPLTGKIQRKGFVVSLPRGAGWEQPEDAEAFKHHARHAVKDYLKRVRQAVKEGKLDRRRTRVGAWTDDKTNRIVLDVNEVFADQKEAERVGRRRKQDAIYDIEHDRVIDLRPGHTSNETFDSYYWNRIGRGIGRTDGADSEGSWTPVVNWSGQSYYGRCERDEHGWCVAEEHGAPEPAPAAPGLKEKPPTPTQAHQAAQAGAEAATEARTEAQQFEQAQKGEQKARTTEAKAADHPHGEMQESDLDKAGGIQGANKAMRALKATLKVAAGAGGVALAAGGVAMAASGAPEVAGVSLDLAGRALGKAGKGVSIAEHAIKSLWADKIPQGLAKLPGPLQPLALHSHGFLSLLGKHSLSALFASFTGVQKIASEVSKERGNSEEETKKLMSTLGKVDLGTFETMKVAAIAGVHVAHLGAAVTGLLPIASAGYLGYSFVRNPVKTVRGARNAVRQGAQSLGEKAEKAQAAWTRFSAGSAHSTGGMERFLGNCLVVNAHEFTGSDPRDPYGAQSPNAKKNLKKLNDALAAHNFSGWYMALLAAAMDASNNGDDAIELANHCWDEDSKGPEQDDEPTANLDRLGGEEPEVDADALKKADFVTLPKKIEGTNCGNCLYVREKGDGHVCSHPKLKGQPVNDRNCCGYWDNKGALREWKKELADNFTVTEVPFKNIPGTYTVVTANVRWQFHTDPEKVRAFQAWLQAQLADLIAGQQQQAIWQAYVQQGFLMGAGRAFTDTRQRERRLHRQGQEQLDFYDGTREEFMRDSFGRPESIDKVKLLAGRTFDELDGITDTMSTRMTRELTDGLVEGKNPWQISKDLAHEVDIGRSRAMLISQTEFIRAHAEGQLDALDKLGVEDVGVAVEFLTAGDDRVCEDCAALEGVVLKLDEARNLIPVHPRCRCAFTPANVGEDEEERGHQKRTKRAIDDALDEAGIDDLDIDRDRPQSILNRLVSNAGPPDEPREHGRWTSSGGEIPTAKELTDKIRALKVDGEHYVVRDVHAWAKKLDKDVTWWVQQKGGGVQFSRSPEAAARKMRALLTPRSTDNVYCPTGEGGGVDPSCSPQHWMRLLAPAKDTWEGRGRYDRTPPKLPIPPFRPARTIAGAEQYAWNLGVNATYTTRPYGSKRESKKDLFIANTVNRVLAEAKARGWAIPRNVAVTTTGIMPQSAVAGYEEPHDDHVETLWINRDNDKWGKDGGSLAEKSHANRWMVAETVPELIVHELGHCNHLHQAGYEDYHKYDEWTDYLAKAPISQLRRAIADVERKRQIAEKVSRYAKASPGEFVAEVWVGLSKGIKYDKDIMDLYHEIKGPDPGKVKVAANVFCPTGQGGGVDPSCGKNGAAVAALKSPSERQETLAMYRERHLNVPGYKPAKTLEAAVRYAKSLGLKDINYLAHGSRRGSDPESQKLALDAANVANKVLTYAKQHHWTLPKGINLVQGGRPSDEMANYDPRDDSLNINMPNKAWGEHGANALERAEMILWLAVGSLDGVICHELGHCQWSHNQQLRKQLMARQWVTSIDPYEYSDPNREILEREDTAREVSRYASQRPGEFVAETFSGLVFHRHYSDAVMKLYHSLGGQDPT